MNTTITYPEDQDGQEDQMKDELSFLDHFLIFVLIIVIFCATWAFIFLGPGFTMLTGEVSYKKISEIDYMHLSERVGFDRDVCDTGKEPEITQVILIADNPVAIVPDIIDAHYTCGLNTPEKAFLWDPKEKGA